MAPPGAIPREPWLALGLAALTLLVYAPVRGYDYVSYDDLSYVVKNPMVNQGLSLQGIAWAATASSASNWHPLTWISLMLDTSLFGATPGAYHVVNVLLHAANGVLLFLLLGQLTGALWRSAFVAALFAMHPLHVESVAWIAERKDVLSTAFGLLTIAAYARWTRAPSRARYALALVLFALGLMAKPMLVSWPFVLLLFDYWPLQRTKSVAVSRLVLEKLPFLALAAASSVVTFLVQRAGGAVQDTVRYPPLDRVANALVSWAEYAWKMLWPQPLAFFYPYPAEIPVAKTLLSLALLVALTAWAWRARPHAPWALMGWLFYLGTLVPVIGLIQVGNQRMGDRYTYVPSIGLFIAAVWSLAERFDATPEARRRLAIAGGVALLVFGAMTTQQVPVWQNSITLFEHAIAAVPGNAPAHLNLGTDLYEMGRRDESIAHFREVVRIAPDWGVGYHNLGAALLGVGSTEESIGYLAEAARRMPERADYAIDLGQALLKQGRADEAEAALQTALRLDPGSVRAHALLAHLRPIPHGS